jgi:phosphatidylinositol-3-phosphatase
MRGRGVAVAICAAALLAGPGAGAASAVPPIKHVFIVVLENEDAATTFGTKTQAPYLAQTLRAQGAFVPGYYATGHLSLDNYISMVSGQGPNPYTQADAPLYINFLPGAPAADGQYIGQGSVYPTQVKTIADQLGAKDGTWGGYMEDMANSKTGEPKKCRHPAIGAQDQTQSAREGDQYAARHNPFVYFHSIIDDEASCKANDVDLRRLPDDLQSASTTPDYVFITPNLCHDGHDSPCTGSNEPGGLVSANAFLEQWIPKILASPAYADGGLVIINFDEAETHDADACCGEKQGPNTPNNGGPQPGAGGGRVGAVLLSRYIKPGTSTKQQYNHYSLLRSSEDYFGLSHLGYAASPGLRPFGDDIFTNPSGKLLPPVKPPKVSVRLGKLPSPCIRKRFRVRVHANGAGITTVVKLDRAKLKTSHAHHFRVRIHARRLEPGRHRLRVTTTDRFGRRATKSRRFRRCAPPRSS